ncbi:MAG TPA: hypothetical protein VFF06_31300 [Polyangia bacterium]|nr:hypothetical protein [Polyangia bacterium]
MLLLLLAIAWAAVHYGKLGRIGSGYAAEQTCSCLFVSGRALESCKHDLEPLAQKIVTLTPGDAEVTARVFGLMRARARYEPGFGCALVE